MYKTIIMCGNAPLVNNIYIKKKKGKGKKKM
jgi:hypothetical protein